MSMESDFLALLKSDATILGLVTTAGKTRIYPSTFAQATANPAIRYMKVTGSTGLHMQGSDGLSDAIVQVDVRSSVGAVEAWTIRDALVAKLHGFSGVQGGTDFDRIGLSSDRGVQFDDTGAVKYYVASIDFNVTSRAAA